MSPYLEISMVIALCVLYSFRELNILINFVAYFDLKRNEMLSIHLLQLDR